MIDNNTTVSGCFDVRDRYTCALDTMAEASRMGVYCACCGRIVVLDRGEMNVRMNLGKELECSSCRNRRIFREIQEMDDHFNGVVEPDSAFV